MSSKYNYALAIGLIALNMQGVLVDGKKYPNPLPELIADWYCYHSAGGHSALVIPEKYYQFEAENPGAELAGYLLPAPIKTILRGWRVAPGMVGGQLLDLVVIDIDHSPAVGLLAPPEDTEW